MYLIEGLGYFTAGFGSATLLGLGVSRRLIKRLTARKGLVTTLVALETRRAAYDSGRDLLARQQAGTPARVVDGMRYRPGSLSVYLNNLGTL